MLRVVVRFEQQPVCRAGSQALLVMVEAKADVEACIEERLQLLRFSTEAMKHPGQLGLQIFTQTQKPVEGFHTMDDEWFTHLLAQAYLLPEDLLLPFKRRALQSIQSTFPDGNHCREVWDNKLCRSPPRVESPGVATVNNSHNVPSCRNMVSMEVDVSHGTGSYPLPPQGWQRNRRFTASHKPFSGPCFCKASTAY